jgi:hypothetical protein
MPVRDAEKLTYIETAKVLKSRDRRLFLARVVQQLGRGGQSWAEAHLGWCRRTIRKGLHELESGIRCQNAFSARGRKAAGVHLPSCGRISKRCWMNTAKQIPPFRRRVAIRA